MGIFRQNRSRNVDTITRIMVPDWWRWRHGDDPHSSLLSVSFSDFGENIFRKIINQDFTETTIIDIDRRCATKKPYEIQKIVSVVSRSSNVFHVLF